MRITPFNNSDGYRYVPNWIEIKDLRKINKTNFIKHMIDEQNENVKEEIKNREIEYKNVKTDMDKAIEMIRSTMKQADISFKNQTENNNVAQKQFQLIDLEFRNLENESNMLQAEIRRMETEINTLSSCYSFLLELVSPEKQKIITAEIELYWDKQFKKYKKQLDTLDVSKLKGSVEIFLSKKNFLINTYKVEDYMPRINIETKEDQDILKAQ